MVIVGSCSDTKIEGGEDEPPIESGTTYQVLKCHVCPDVTVRSFYWHDDMPPELPVDFKILFPSDPKMPIGLPESIEKAFRAAIKVRSVDANAFGVLIGRVMDMVCRDRGAEGRFLGNKLADLAAKGEVPQKLVEVAEKLTKLRNVGAHAELGELTPREVPIVEDLCRALLDYIYTAPHLAMRADETLTSILKS
jgi:hypothetical protein